MFPLVATGLLVQELVGRNQTDSVDGSLAATVSGAAVSYRWRSSRRLPCERRALIAAAPRRPAGDRSTATSPTSTSQTIDGADHAVIESGDVRVGVPPEGPAWKTRP